MNLCNKRRFTQNLINKMLEGMTTKVEETERVYHFPKGDRVVLRNVFELVVRPSGTHRLKTKDKKMHIVPTGWIHIEILSPKDWVV